MASDGLRDHYERKYEQERASSFVIPEVRTEGCPADRFQAAVRFFSQSFNGGDVLELGGGSGVIAKALLGRDKRINRYVVSDLSRPRLDAVRHALADSRLEVREVDAEQASQAEGTFDAVLMIALIEHLIDPMRAMQDVRRVLRPGGFVYIDTPNIAKYTRRLKLAFGRFPSTASLNEGLTTYSGQPVDLYDEGHLHYFTYRSLSRMLIDRCGFLRVSCHGYATVPRLFGPKFDDRLARTWPQMFSDVVVVAYA